MNKCAGKVSIIGCGAVGTAAAFAILLKGIAREIALIDINEKRVLGEALDLKHGSVFFETCSIKSGSKYELCKDSDVVVISAGAAQKPGESRLSLAERNASVLRKVVPCIAKFAPNSILLIVTNPVDVMTMLALKLSGFPKRRVFGSGTTLDTSRLKFLIGQEFKVNPKSVHAYILGEHGDSEFPLWSHASIGGVHINKLPGYSKEKAKRAFANAQNAAYDIINLKGCTNFAIGTAVAHLVKDVFTDDKRVTPLSVHLANYQGVSNVCMSVPCILGSRGIEKVLPIEMNSLEKKQFLASAQVIKETAKKLKI